MTNVDIFEHVADNLRQDIGIEKSPSYFVTENAPERVHAMNKSILLLLIVRDPVNHFSSQNRPLLYLQRAISSNKAKVLNVQTVALKITFEPTSVNKP